MSAQTLVYVDASVWLSYVLRDGNAEKAKQALDRFDQGSHKAIVSTLVILEILDVLRKRVTEKESYQIADGTMKQQIKQKVDERIREFIDKVTKLTTQGKAVIIDPSTPTGEYMTEALKLHSPRFGNIDTQTLCPVCRGPFGPRYRYRGPGHWDVQHALNAKYTSASELVSFDGGFKELRSDFSSLTFTVI